MSDEKQPEYVWAFPPERERKAGKVWLIIGLAVLAVAIAAALFWLFFRPGDGTAAHPTTSPTASVSPTASATPDATSSPAPTPTPSPTPSTTVSAEPTPPAPTAPDLAAFRDRVIPVLQSAATGLGYARDEGGMTAMHDIILLQEDAQRLAESIPPTSIAQAWRDAVQAYQQTLEPLRAAYERGENARSEDEAAAAALTRLTSVVNAD